MAAAPPGTGDTYGETHLSPPLRATPWMPASDSSRSPEQPINLHQWGPTNAGPLTSTHGTGNTGHTDTSKGTHNKTAATNPDKISAANQPHPSPEHTTHHPSERALLCDSNRKPPTPRVLLPPPHTSPPTQPTPAPIRRHSQRTRPPCVRYGQQS